MKRSGFRFILTAVAAAVLLGLPCVVQQAESRGFGGGGGGFHGSGGGAGFHGSDGFSGGSFRESGAPHSDFERGGGEITRGGSVERAPGAVEGPRGGEYEQGPRGGEAYRGPQGGEAYRGPHGDEAYRGPGGAYGYRGGSYSSTNINVNQGWGGYYGSNWGAAAAGAAVGLAVGAAVASLPAAAQPVVVNNQNYYVSDGTYYQPCYQGADVSYCVVDSPY